MDYRPWHDEYDYTVQPSYRYPKLPVGDLLAIPAGSQPDKTALNFMGAEISFFELRQYALKMASALAGLGIGKGDRVVLHLPNCPQYPIAYYAALMNGAIVTNANPMYTPHELKYIVEETTPRAPPINPPYQPNGRRRRDEPSNHWAYAPAPTSVQAPAQATALSISGPPAEPAIISPAPAAAPA